MRTAALPGLLTALLLAACGAATDLPAPRPPLARPALSTEVRPGHLLSEADRAHFRAALAAARDNRWQLARTRIAEVRDPLPGKVVTWLWLLGNDADATHGPTRAFFDANPRWPLRRLLQRQLERRMPTHAPHDALLGFFADHPPVGADGRVLRLRALAQAGRAAEARAAARAIWTGAILNPDQEHLLLQEFGDTLGQDEHLERLQQMLWRRSWGGAQRQLGRVPEDYRRLGEARLHLARRQRGVDAAVARVPPELQDDPGLRFDRIRWRRHSGFHDRALTLLEDPPQELGNPSFWWYESRFFLRWLLKERQWERAYQLALLYPRLAAADRAEASWLAGWIALEFLRRPAEARTHLAAMRESVRRPISVARAEYWLARTARAMGDEEAARRHIAAAGAFPETYFGQRARVLSGHPVALPVLPRPTAAERAAYQTREQVRVLRMLAEAGAEDVARHFAVHLADLARSDAELVLLHEVCMNAGMPQHAIRVAKQGVRNGRNLPTLLFPLPRVEDFPWPPDGVEPIPQALALAVANQESAFSPDAISPAGALGLMQVMPATARAATRRIGTTYERQRLLEDPAHNLQLGTAVMGAYLERFAGSLPLAIAAYNGGPQRVEATIERHGDPRTSAIDLENWIALLPVQETRNYVHRVLEGLAVYRWKLSPHSAPAPRPAPPGALVSAHRSHAAPARAPSRHRAVRQSAPPPRPHRSAPAHNPFAGR